MGQQRQELRHQKQHQNHVGRWHNQLHTVPCQQASSCSAAINLNWMPTGSSELWQAHSAGKKETEVVRRTWKCHDYTALSPSPRVTRDVHICCCAVFNTLKDITIASQNWRSCRATAVSHSGRQNYATRAIHNGAKFKALSKPLRGSRGCPPDSLRGTQPKLQAISSHRIP